MAKFIVQKIYRQLSWILICIFPLCSLAQQTAEKYVQETHYLLYLPEGYLSDTLQRNGPYLFFYMVPAKVALILKK